MIFEEQKQDGLKNKKIMKTKILIGMLMAILLVSCHATRNVNKTTKTDISKSETTEKTETAKTDEINVKKTKEVKVDDQNETVTEKNIFEPIDLTKPAIHTDESGNKIELNNIKQTTTTTTTKNNTKITENEKIEIKEKKKEEQIKEIKEILNTKTIDTSKNTETKGFNFIYFLWLLLVFPLYCIWKNKAIIFGWIKKVFSFLG